MRHALLLLAISGLAAPIHAQHLAPQLSTADKNVLKKSLKDVRKLFEDHAKHGRLELGLIVHDDAGLDVTVAQVCRADGETAAARVKPAQAHLLWLLVSERHGVSPIALSTPDYLKWRATVPAHVLHRFVLAPTADIAIETDRAMGAPSTSKDLGAHHSALSVSTGSTAVARRAGR